MSLKCGTFGLRLILYSDIHRTNGFRISIHPPGGGLINTIVIIVLKEVHGRKKNKIYIWTCINNTATLGETTIISHVQFWLWPLRAGSERRHRRRPSRGCRRPLTGTQTILILKIRGMMLKFRFLSFFFIREGKGLHQTFRKSCILSFKIQPLCQSGCEKPNLKVKMLQF